MDRRRDQFQHILRDQIEELGRLQRETNRAVEALLSGKGGDMQEVLAAMQRSDDAFQSLLAAREKLIKVDDPAGSMPMQA